MFKFLMPLIFAGALCLPATAQMQSGWAPEIEVKKWANEPVGTSLADLRGRVVFLEFWATW
ncbi:MAG: hypothetical protein QGH51_06165 [Planctomycetota bacterium]|jgi:hypothetical protein|nr:hypothetical protein [Planctomycetota bacterium]